LVELALWFLGIAIAFRIFQLYSAFSVLLRLRLCPPSARALAEGDVPEWMRAGLRSVEHELESLGFERALWFEEIEFVDTRAPRISLLMRHRTEAAFAALGFSDAPDRFEPFRAWFSTYFDDRTALVTINGLAHALIGAPPNTVIADPYALTLAEQWAEHARRLAELSAAKRPIDGDAERFLERSRESDEALLRALVESGRAIPSKHDPSEDPGAARFQLSWAAAFGTALRMVRGGRKASKLQRARFLRAQAADRASLPVEAEVAAYERVEALRMRPAPRQLVLWTFFVSAALFAASFAIGIDLFALALVIVVLLFHELGHYAAMRIFGYAETRIFFIPFFGAATLGRKTNASLIEEVSVLLAGPVPGLLLALAIMSFVPGAPSGWLGFLFFVPNAPWAWLGLLARMLIAINAINLLPIFPLDGGRIVHRVLFDRSPVLDLSFRGLAAVSLVAAGLAATEWAFTALGILIAISLRSSARAARVRRSLEAIDPARLGSFAARAAAVFRALDDTSAKSSSFAQRATIARPLIDGLDKKRPRARDVAFGLCAYGASVATIAVGFAMLASRDGSSAARGLRSRPLGPYEAFDCSRPPDLAAVAAAEEITVECTSPDEREAETLAADLDAYLLASQAMMLKAPWDETVEVTYEEANARRTYRRLQREAGRKQSAWLRDGSREREFTIDEWRHEELAALDRWLAEHRNAGGIDPEIVRLYREQIAEPERAAEVIRAIARRMGRDERDSAPATSASFGVVSRDSATIRIAWLSFAAPGPGLRALGSFLCRRGCGSVRYAVAVRPKFNP
jgi:Zn-dependent protease